MSSREELEQQAARFLIEQDDPNFSDEQRAELTRWMMQSVQHCKAYLQLVQSWRWTVLLYRDEAPLVQEKSGTSPLQRALDCSFGEVLREYREERGLSHGELAADTGMRVSEITKIEAGDRTVTLISTCVLARALSVAPSRLISRLDRVMSAKETSRSKPQSSTAGLARSRA